MTFLVLLVLALGAQSAGPPAVHKYDQTGTLKFRASVTVGSDVYRVNGTPCRVDSDLQSVECHEDHAFLTLTMADGFQIDGIEAPVSFACKTVAPSSPQSPHDCVENILYNYALHHHTTKLDCGDSFSEKACAKGETPSYDGDEWKIPYRLHRDKLGNTWIAFKNPDGAGEIFWFARFKGETQ